MRFLFFLALVSVHCLRSQNNLNVYTKDGSLIQLYISDSLVNKEPQASILVQRILKDTFQIKVLDENKRSHSQVVYLLDKGNHCKYIEFNYLVELKNEKMKIVFDGVEAIPPMPATLVPKKPVIDTSMKYRNRTMGHYCEMKEGKPSYFNNIPKDGTCIDPMPEVYLTYMSTLMFKAHTDDDRYIIAENTTRLNCVSVAQMMKILEYVPFELEKLKLIKSSYFHISDRKNCAELDNTFKLEASKTELLLFLKTAESGKIDAASTCSVASKNDDIKKLQIQLDASTSDAERLDVFRKIYDRYCYSLSQARSIVTLFSHDNERLSAAKLIYYYCTDKKNFLNLSDIFSYGSTKLELKDFIEKQG